MKKTTAILLVFIFFAVGCTERTLLTVPPITIPGGTSQAPSEEEPLAPGQTPSPVSMIFVEKSDGRYNYTIPL